MKKLGTNIENLMTIVVDKEQDEFVKDLAITELKRLHGNIKEFLGKYDTEDEEYHEVEVDLNLIECTQSEQEKLIKLNEQVSIEMRYPTYTDILGVEQDAGLETSLELISSCIDKVYNDEETLQLADFTSEEQEEFINSFPADTFAAIQKYFEDMPKVKMEVKYKIKVEGKQKTKKKMLEGINDFFS